MAYVQVYTGDGKGKTTAAIGLAVRAMGAGMKVLLAQFLKKGEFSEIKALRQFGKQITIMQFGSGRFVRGRPVQDDCDRAAKGLAEVRRLVNSGSCDIAILDEINVAMDMGLLPVDEVLDFIDQRPSRLELVLTGRHAPKEIVDAADLVSECRMVKHYLALGVKARTGIEK